MSDIISEEYLDLIIENELLYLYDLPDQRNITAINAKHSILHIPSAGVDKCILGEYGYHLFPTCYSLESIQSLEASDVIRLQNNPNFMFYGQGVLIGIIDTGIEYQHEAFLREDNTSRIVSIWDQTIQDIGAPPEGYTYGAEFTQEVINEALRSDNPLAIVPSIDEIGHGTRMAGIVAGKRNEAQNFSGVVPQAELVVVKMKQAKQNLREVLTIPPQAICYQETDIMLGIRYITSIAQQLNRPLSLCLALGSGLGGHDGFGALSSYISIVSLYPRTNVVVAAGNEGNSSRHFLGTFTSQDESKGFELNVSEKDQIFAMEIWQSSPFRIALDITSPTGEYTAPIRPRIGQCQRISYIFEPSRLWVNNSLIEGETGDQLVLVRFVNPLSGIWRFRVHNIDRATSQFNVWLPAGELISTETFLIDSSPNITITSPGNAIVPITATAYNAASGGIAISASRGYTRVNAIKPDIAAPGVDVICPIPGNRYGTVTGTGAAAAHTAGIAAMLLEWGVLKGNFPSMDTQYTKTFLIRGAIRSAEMEFPNNVWGYGKINIFEGFERMR